MTKLGQQLVVETTLQLDEGWASIAYALRYYYDVENKTENYYPLTQLRNA